MTTSTRHARTERLLGNDGVKRLKEAHITLCGLGAVGSFAAEALARAGVGHLSIVDFDVISQSNINRQLYALTSTVGMKKTAVAEARIKDINPQCEVTIFDCKVGEETLDAILAPPMDLVVDAIDSLYSKVNLIKDAMDHGIPVISSMGAAGKKDASAVVCGDISETAYCPLARMVRRHLHRRGIYEGVRCIYSREQAQDRHTASPGDTTSEETASGLVLGSISYLTAIFGLHAASEAIRMLLERE